MKHENIDFELWKELTNFYLTKEAFEELTPEEKEEHKKEYNERLKERLILRIIDSEGRKDWHIEKVKQRKKELEKKETEELKEIFEKTKKPIQDVVNVSAYDPLKLAEEFINKQPIFYNESKIWWMWTDKWEITDEINIINELRKHYYLYELLSKDNKSKILEALKLEGRKNKPEEAPASWIQFQNKVYDIETGEEYKATPKYFLTNVCPYKPGISEETPTIDNIFTEWVGEKYIQTLYEIIAYSLYRDYPIHRIFIFIGRGSNGKGQFFQLITKFLGNENTASTELDYLLTNRFEAVKLYKKLIAQMSETNTNELSKTSLLKKLSGNDLIGYEFKNKNPFDAKNYAKILISTNSLPTTKDKTDGFYRRMMIIMFPNQFTEKKDIIGKIPEEEYNNLARKSLRILKELLDKREFTNEGSIKDRAKIYEEQSNPLDRFIKENCKEDMNESIPKFIFQEKFLSWLTANGYRNWNSTEIGRAMKEKYEDKKEPHVNKTGETKYWNSWIGLIFKEDLNKFPGFPEFPPSSTQTLHRDSKWEWVETLETMEKRNNDDDSFIKEEEDLKDLSLSDVKNYVFKVGEITHEELSSLIKDNKILDDFLTK